jgi:hypothetical protein
MKPYLRILVALSFCISQSAFGQDAIATGAGAPTTDGMTATTTDPTTGASTSTVFGSGAIPGGLEEAAASIKASLATIAALPAQAIAGGADFAISGLPVMQSSGAEYESTRVACYGAQSTASTMCMESTNPNLISTVAAVNLGVAGLNSLAVNDACKGMSKIMTLAQTGMTGFLAVCGAMRLKCNMACGTTNAALAKLSGAAAGAYYCQIINPVTGPGTCGVVTKAYVAAIAKLKAALALEANAADVTVRPVAAKVAICTKGYALMLASGAVSLMSIVNSMKQSKNCDKESDGGGSSGTASTAAAATTTAAASTTGAGTTTTTGTTTETPETSSNLIVAPTTPAASATDTATSSQVRTASANQAAGAAGARGTLSSSGSSLSSSGASTELASTAVNEKTKEYQAYMPGGTKDPSRNIAGQSAYEKEVTAAGGKSNWSKTRDAYRNLKTLEDE